MTVVLLNIPDFGFWAIPQPWRQGVRILLKSASRLQYISTIATGYERQILQPHPPSRKANQGREARTTRSEFREAGCGVRLSYPGMCQTLLNILSMKTQQRSRLDITPFSYHFPCTDCTNTVLLRRVLLHGELKNTSPITTRNNPTVPRALHRRS